MAHDSRRNIVGRVPEAGAARSSVQAPGKTTLVESLCQESESASTVPVQRKASGAKGDDGSIHETAQRGVAEGGSRLPHLDLVQKAFGAHDVSDIQAHTGEAAQHANQEIGAQAYATGNHVAFAGTPDLHTAAHEAAHVVQQRAGVHLKGGVGEAGDAYEQHADAVADRVVAGESAAELLTAGPLASVPGGGWGNGVQRKIAAPVPEAVQRHSTPAPAAGTHPPTTKPDGTLAEPGDVKKIAKLHLYIDIEAQNLGIDELSSGLVGHTWIAIEYNDPATVPDSIHAAHKDLLRAGGKYSDPMGFWPDIANGVGYSTNPFKSYVQGWMRHPDRAHEGAEKAMQTWELTQGEVNAVIAYAESKRGAMYSVYFFNCTTFGVEAVKAAGKSAPPASTGTIMFPNALYDGIKERQKKGVGDTMTKDFDGSNEQVVHGTDTKKG